MDIYRTHIIQPLRDLPREPLAALRQMAAEYAWIASRETEEYDPFLSEFREVWFDQCWDVVWQRQRDFSLAVFHQYGLTNERGFCYFDRDPNETAGVNLLYRLFRHIRAKEDPAPQQPALPLARTVAWN